MEALVEPINNRTEVIAIPVTKEQIASLKKCIESTMASYRVKRRRNKSGAIIVQGAIFVFSIGTTILLGWQLGTQQEGDIITPLRIGNTALVMSALAVGTNTIDKFFDYKSLWVGYNVSIASLKATFAKLEYLESIGPPHITRHQLDDIFIRYESICANMDKTYQEVRSARDE